VQRSGFTLRKFVTMHGHVNVLEVLNVVLKSSTSPIRQITVTVLQVADCRTMFTSHGMGTNVGKGLAS
jgi:hypothetical protein